MPEVRPLAPRRAATALLALVLVLGARPARANQSDEARARAHYENGKIHFRLREFASAVAEFRDAYRIKQIPAILFNMAQAERMTGDYEAAKFHYEQYLEQDPRARNRGAVEVQVRELASLIAARPKSAPVAAAPPSPAVAAPPTPVVAPAKRPEVRLLITREAVPASAPAPVPPPIPKAATAVHSPLALWAALVGGGAVVAAIAGGVLGLQARDLLSTDATSTDGGVTRHALTEVQASRLDGDATGANVLFGAAAVLAVGSGVLFTLSLPRPGAGGGIAVAGRF